MTDTMKGGKTFLEWPSFKNNNVLLFTVAYTAQEQHGFCFYVSKGTIV